MGNRTVQRMVIAVWVGRQREASLPTTLKDAGAEGGKASHWGVVYPLRFFAKVYKRRQGGGVSGLIILMRKRGEVGHFLIPTRRILHSMQSARCPSLQPEVLSHDAHRRSDH
jgi:hypothetical protein